MHPRAPTAVGDALRPPLAAICLQAREITDASIAAIKSGRYDYLRVNYANPDMVGHTGDLEATKTAVAECDACLGQLLKAVDEVSLPRECAPSAIPRESKRVPSRED